MGIDQLSIIIMHIIYTSRYMTNVTHKCVVNCVVCF